MSTSRLSTREIAEMSSALTAMAGIGAGAGAAVRGGSIVESASIVGIGTGLFIVGTGFFTQKSTEKKSRLTALEWTLGLGIIELAGTAIGCIGTKLFIDAAASAMPFVDAAIGFPVTVGLLYSVVTIADYFDQRRQATATAPVLRRG